MKQLKSEAPLEFCYIPLYKVDSCKIKIAFNNARSLHKHCKDIHFGPNVLFADVIGFAESRPCERDENSDFVLNNYRLFKLEVIQISSRNRPYHGIAVHKKQNFEIQRIENYYSNTCKSILATLYSNQEFFVVFFFQLYLSTNIQTVHRLVWKGIFCVILPKYRYEQQIGYNWGF